MPSAADFVDAVEDAVGGEANATKTGETEWAIDFRLPTAEDAPFASGVTFDARSETVTGVALRFSPAILERYSDDELEAKLDVLLERTDPPAGGLWHAYPRGDAADTGPHIISPGDFTTVDPGEFVEWLRRLLSVYDEVFAMANPKIRGPEDVDAEVRDEMCGAVTRAVLAAAGEACTRRSVREVAEQLDGVRGVRVDRWAPAEDQADDRDFIDLTVTRSSSGGQLFLILERNGFSPEALAGNWEKGTPEGEDGRVVLQYKR